MITIDVDPKFDKRALKLCKKANQKVITLYRMPKLLSFEKRKTLFKAFVESQIKHCSIACMFHNQYANNKLDRLHERVHRIVSLFTIKIFSDS